ncbi:MAG TPA: hypothetical protein DCM01_09145 [Dielma fastidiosa]|nr:hypothetical protein [Dielma fastidiosa]
MEASSFDIIKYASFIISLIAFYISFKNFKTNRLVYLYSNLFDDILINKLPNAFNRALQCESSRDTNEFIDLLMQLTDKLSFFQFYNHSMYSELKFIVRDIDENFENYCNEEKPEYVAAVSMKMKELYDVIYNIHLWKILKHNFKNICTK